LSTGHHGGTETTFLAIVLASDRTPTPFKLTFSSVILISLTDICSEVYTVPLSSHRAFSNMAAKSEDATMSDDVHKEDASLRVDLGNIHDDVVKAHKNIKVTCGEKCKDHLEITFHRTVRVPDNNNTYQLPPNLGDFPIYSVQDYKERLPNEMAAKDGLFFPIYRECSLSSYHEMFFSSGA
jgi:hypothetical protein